MRDGKFATRVALLLADSVTIDHDGRVHLSLGETAIRLREPHAHLAVTVAARAGHLDSPWLFPGTEGPMTSEQLRQRLARLGVDRILLARNSARAALAADIRPAPLTDKLGISISAAVFLVTSGRRHALGLCRLLYGAASKR